MLNVPFGWGGGLLCAAICACTGDVRWGKAGCVVYAVSWGMLGLGMLLAGREVAKRFGVRFRSAWRAWRRGLGWKFFR